MTLTLEITSPQRAQLTRPAFTFGLEGGTIGRDPKATWCLPDPKAVLSGQHVRIVVSAGQFTLLDLSRNGVFINGAAEPLGQSQAHTIAEGDTIRISDYELMAHLGQSAQPRVAPGLLNAALPPAMKPTQAALRSPTLFRKGAAADDDDDLADLLGDSVQVSDDTKAMFGWPPPADGPMTEPVTRPAPPRSLAPSPQARQPPAVVTKPWPAPPSPGPLRQTATASMPNPAAVDTTEPDALTLLQRRNAARHQVPNQSPGVDPAPPGPAGAASDADAELIARLWASLGLDPSGIPQENRVAFVEEVGSAMRATAAGLMRAMALRAATKGEFNLQQTMVRPTENNLFKFAADVDELLLLALANRNQLYLPMAQAVADAFDDIQFNEAATLTAVQLSLRSLIDRFNPEKLAQQARRQHGRRWFRSFPAQCWEHFKTVYSNLSADADEASNRIFEIEYGRANRERMRKQPANWP